MPVAQVLVVDDEKNILSSLKRALSLENLSVDVAGSAEIALGKISEGSFDLILLDVQMPGIDGLSMLQSMRESGDLTPVIVMSGHGTIQTAVEATRLGAHDFIEKPIQTERLLVSIRNALRLNELVAENQSLREHSGIFDKLLGTSSAMQRLRERIELAAASQANVLITGERGTGKELVATAIHEGSSRAKARFEKMNCAAVPDNLVESELFGHEAGAFTGATRSRRGKFERADGGTLFLDEIGDMPSAMQAKLLRVLQEGEIERVGGSGVISVDVRIVAATNRSLSAMVDDGSFRADFLDRLNVLPIAVPALRERKEDVPLLAERFLALAAARNDRRSKSLSADAIRYLTGYSFPGNVRELQNLVERLVILTAPDEISESAARALLALDSPKPRGDYFEPDKPLREMIENAERDVITRALEHHAGHVTKTAEALGLERSHLYKKMKALGLRKSGDE